MMGFRQAALAGALAAVAGITPGTAYAQSRSTIVRAMDIGRSSRIGVSVNDVDAADSKDAKAARAGVLVESVTPGGPADKAGVKAGDTITEFDGEKVRSARQFSRLVSETPAGRAVAVAVSRGGQRVALNVTTERASIEDDFWVRPLDMPLAALPPTPPTPPAAPRPPAIAPAAPMELLRLVGGRRLGVSVETLDSQLAQYFGVKDGVLVRSVSASSDAEKLGLKAGDVITAINGRQVYEASDINRALDRMDTSDDITIDVTRDKKAQTLKGKLEARTRRGGTRSF